MEILDEAPGIFILLGVVAAALIMWGCIGAMYDAVEADNVAQMIVFCICAIIMLIVTLLGAGYLALRVLS